MEFWNDIAADRSWEVLVRLRKEFDFILIGGWAVYLYTKAIKSKDIDIIADFDSLDKIKRSYRLKKTGFLKKYQISAGGVSVDIYVPFYSRLAVPVDFIQKNFASIGGFKIPSREVLLILKQQAELERRDSVRGQKDRVDILSLLIKGDANLGKYQSILKEFRLQGYEKRLKEIVNSGKKEYEYLGISDYRKTRLLKRKILEKLA